jgi:AP-3 complex subunit beta
MSLSNRKTYILKEITSSSVLVQKEGMINLIELIGRGMDAHELLPYVVKLIHTESLPLKKLVLVFLESMNEKDCFLAVNSLHKELNNSKNPYIKALSLHLLCSLDDQMKKKATDNNIIYVSPSIIQKCAKDVFPAVRKVVCFSLPRLEKTEALNILSTFLNDDPEVINCALQVFNVYFPTELELIHPHYRRLCEKINLLNEFGQTAFLRICLDYCRTFFKSPVDSTVEKNSGNFYDQENNGFNNGMNRDLYLLLESCKPLLYSLSPGVVLHLRIL